MTKCQFLRALEIIYFSLAQQVLWGWALSIQAFCELNFCMSYSIAWVHNPPRVCGRCLGLYYIVKYIITKKIYTRGDGDGGGGVIWRALTTVDVADVDWTDSGALGRVPAAVGSGAPLGDVERGWRDNGAGGGAVVVVAHAQGAMDVLEGDCAGLDMVGCVPEVVPSSDPLGDVARSGANTIGGWAAAGVVCIVVGAVDVEEGDSVRPGPLGRGLEVLWSSVPLVGATTALAGAPGSSSRLTCVPWTRHLSLAFGGLS